MLKVTGYDLWRVPHSKRGNSQCSLAPDYGYKRWSTDREAPRAYTQSEGIGYLVGTVCRGWSNFVNFWTKIWPAEQPRTTSDTPYRQFLTYSRAKRSIFFGSVIRFLRNNPSLSSKTVHISRLFASVNYNSQQFFFKMALSGPALSIKQYIGN